MTSVSTKRILRMARSLVRTGWTKGAGARNRHGFSTVPGAPDAVQFCALGAIERAAGTDQRGAKEAILTLAHTLHPERDYWVLTDPLTNAVRDVSTFNDAPETRKVDVLALFDKAARKAWD
jgi:hypothetical protein